MSQLVDDVLNSIMETEAKISEAAESLEGVISEIRGLKYLPSNSPVMNETSVSIVTNEMAGESTSNMSAPGPGGCCAERRFILESGHIPLLYLFRLTLSGNGKRKVSINREINFLILRSLPDKNPITVNSGL